MSGYLRFWFAAFLFLAGLSPSPASSNPFAVFLGQAVPAEATAQRPAEQECLSQPGKSTADGRHWVYRFNNHRKCWFQAAEETVTKEPIHHHAGKHVAAPKATQAVSRKRNAVVDARAELPQSVPVKPPQQPPPALELKVVAAAPLTATRAAALVPPAPVVAKPATYHDTPDHPAPRQVDVETLLAAAPANSGAVAATVAPANPVAVPSADGRGWTATWLGLLLIELGFVSLLSSSRTLRDSAGRLTSWAIARAADGVGGHRGRPLPESSFAFGRNTSHPATKPERSWTADVRSLALRVGH